MMYRTLASPGAARSLFHLDRPEPELARVCVVPWDEVQRFCGEPYDFKMEQDEAVLRAVLSTPGCPFWIRLAWQEWREEGFAFIRPRGI